MNIYTTVGTDSPPHGHRCHSFPDVLLMPGDTLVITHTITIDADGTPEVVTRQIDKQEATTEEAIAGLQEIAEDLS